MQLTEEAVAVLSPNEMHVLRKKTLAMPFQRLSELSNVSVAQLNEYERGRNGLRPDQLRTIERVLLEEARNRSQVISKLLEPEQMAAAS